MLEVLVAGSSETRLASYRRVEAERSVLANSLTAKLTDTASSAGAIDRRIDELAERVALALAALGYPPLAAVRCDMTAGRVVLSGILPSYHLKQMAQVAALGVAGPGRVDNRVIVTSR